jgi:hypothetical protein
LEVDIPLTDISDAGGIEDDSTDARVKYLVAEKKAPNRVLQVGSRKRGIDRWKCGTLPVPVSPPSHRVVICQNP